MLETDFNYFLNSDDLHEPELPTIRNRSLGGTMLLWHRNIDPFIEIIPPTSPAFLIAVLRLPGLETSLHVTLYLPTHGKDFQFISDLADLRNCLDKMLELHSDPAIYIMGDSNLNKKNASQVVLLQRL